MVLKPGRALELCEEAVGSSDAASGAPQLGVFFRPRRKKYRLKLTETIALTKAWYEPAVAAAARRRRITVVAVTMAGKRAYLSDIRLADTVGDLRSRVVKELRVKSDVTATLCVDSQRLTADSMLLTLGEVGIHDGGEVLCVMQPAIFEVKPGLRVKLSGAGIQAVNATYRCTHGGVFIQETPVYNGGDEYRIMWYRQSSEWPAAWYISRRSSGIYQQSSYTSDCLPMNGWEVYSGDYAIPEVATAPAPTIEFVSD